MPPKNQVLTLAFLIAALGAPLAAETLRGDGTILAPGPVQFELERSGAPDEDLRVQALVMGHRQDGSMEALLTSQEIEVLPTSPSRAELNVSESSFEQWSREFAKITAALKVVPRPGAKVQWKYENLLDPAKSQSPDSGVRVHGRWVAP